MKPVSPGGGGLGLGGGSNLTRFWSGTCHRSFKSVPVPYTNFPKKYTRPYTNFPKSRKSLPFLIPKSRKSIPFPMARPRTQNMCSTPSAGCRPPSNRNHEFSVSRPPSNRNHEFSVSRPPGQTETRGIIALPPHFFYQNSQISANLEILIKSGVLSLE